MASKMASLLTLFNTTYYPLNPFSEGKHFGISAKNGRKHFGFFDIFGRKHFGFFDKITIFALKFRMITFF